MFRCTKFVNERRNLKKIVVEKIVEVGKNNWNAANIIITAIQTIFTNWNKLRSCKTVFV